LFIHRRFALSLFLNAQIQSATPGCPRHWNQLFVSVNYLETSITPRFRRQRGRFIQPALFSVNYIIHLSEATITEAILLFFPPEQLDRFRPAA